VVHPLLARLLGHAVSPLEDGATPLTDWQVTVLLLDQPWAYRQRCVDEVSLQTEGLYRLRRSVQLLPVRPMLEEAGLTVAEGEAPAIIPLSLMRKAALLEFDVTGPDGKPAFFLSRRVTANLQVDFMIRLAESSGVDTPDEVVSLLYGMSLFTPGKLDGPKLRHNWYQPAQVAYALELAHGRKIAYSQIVAWQKSAARTAALLAQALPAPRDKESSSENPLLALLDGPEVGLTTEQITARLAAYFAWVDALTAAGDQDTLGWVATFGRRYVALIDTVLDPDRPALVKMTERRELPLTSRPALGWKIVPVRRFRCKIDLETREAQSYHLRVRTEDESIGLYGVPKIKSEIGEPVGANDLDGATAGSDGYALYTSKPDRPGHVKVTMPMRTSGDVRRSLTLVSVLAVAAAALALSHTELDKTAISLITLPATFSATVLLVRERTTLSARLLRDYKWALVIAVLVLWLASLARVTDRYPPGAADPDPSASPSSPAASPPTASAPPSSAPLAPPGPRAVPGTSPSPNPQPTP
jgi:hypothetical protein